MRPYEYHMWGRGEEGSPRVVLVRPHGPLLWFNQRPLQYLSLAGWALRGGFENVISRRSLTVGDSVQDPIERNLRISPTGLAASNHFFRSAKRCGTDCDDPKLIGRRIEE